MSASCPLPSFSSLGLFCPVCSQQPNALPPYTTPRFKSNREEYNKEVQKCVIESQEKKYENEPGSSLKFSQPTPQHAKLRENMQAPPQMQPPTPTQAAGGSEAAAAAATVTSTAAAAAEPPPPAI